METGQCMDIGFSNLTLAQMKTISVNIPKITIDAFRKMADKCKKNVPGFDYSVGGELNQRYAHLCDFGEGKHVEYFIHPVFPVEIQMPDDCGWQLLATYKDGYEYIADPKEKLIISNPNHGKGYHTCDVCRHWCKNSFLIRNTTTGEELQVGSECVKKFGLHHIQMISKFTASLYTDYIISYGIFDIDMDCMVWSGEPDRFAFSAITKSSLICAAKTYYDENPVWIKGYRDNGYYVKSESNNNIQRIVSHLKESEVNEEYAKTVCDYILTQESISEFSDNMHRLAKDYYATPADAVYAFFMVKYYEDMLKSKVIGMDKFKEGVQLHVVGEILDIKETASYFGILTTYTIKTNSGVIIKRTGKVPYKENDNIGTVDFYALIKSVRGIEITVDRACKNAKKGIETISV